MEITLDHFEVDLEHVRDYPGLQIIPVINHDSQQTSVEKILWEGFQDESIKIKELDSSSVPTVQLTNTTDELYLGYRGAIIRGGGQNRQLLHSVVIPGKRSLSIPVQCIQSGRWNPHQEKIFTHKASDITSSSLRYKRYSQTETWSKISETTRMSGTSSTTQDYTVMHDFMFGSEQEASIAAESMTVYRENDFKRRKASRQRAQKILKELLPLENQVGVYIRLIEPSMCAKKKYELTECLEIFSCPTVYRKIHEVVLSSFVADASILPEDDPQLVIPAVTQQHFSEFMDMIDKASWKEQPSIGQEKRQEIRQDKKLFGESIFQEKELVHLMCSLEG